MTTEKYQTPRLCNISPEARKICDELQMRPSDAIVWLRSENNSQDIQKVVNDAIRMVAQTEGVMLHEKQKGFFRDLFGSLLDVLRDKGAKP